MDLNKSLDEIELIAALLRDVQMSHGVWFNKRALKLTVSKLRARAFTEGIGFLTKTLPKLGRALDKALAGTAQLNSTSLGFKALSGSELPMFMGEFFSRVLQPNGTALQNPCATSIRVLRQVLLQYAKYELKYTDKQEQEVLSAFKNTENDLTTYNQTMANRLFCVGESLSNRRNIDLEDRDPQGFPKLRNRRLSTQPHVPHGTRDVDSADGYDRLPHGFIPLLGDLQEVCRPDCCNSNPGRLRSERLSGRETGPTRLHFATDDDTQWRMVIRVAKRRLKRLFVNFDPKDIIPRHGPGRVSGKELYHSKWRWSNIPDRILTVYPLDEYFYSSLGGVCDSYKGFSSLTSDESSAKVLLVPKDSRGPRLISCEPLEFMWVQQGLGRAIVKHVEEHVLTKHNVFFTDQGPNRRGACLGSETGKYATLDLKEASDRVSLELVRLLFPEGLMPYLEACRSLSTELPDGQKLLLKKFAPMGSALCFPVLALTIWAILSAGAPDADTREGILVYGDDVIVPTAYAANAMELLESFGLLINRDKSCTSGSFRESCGMDAFKGIDVTPVRIRTLWSSSPSPESYVSWVSYANSFLRRGYREAYDYIVGSLHRLYGAIPAEDMHLACPSLIEVPRELRPKKRRVNQDFQRLEYLVRDVKSVTYNRDINGWSMLLRFFSEGGEGLTVERAVAFQRRHVNINWPSSLDSHFEWGDNPPISVRQYTKRKSSKLVMRWR